MTIVGVGAVYFDCKLSRCLPVCLTMLLLCIAPVSLKAMVDGGAVAGQAQRAQSADQELLEKGKGQFLRCNACHALSAEDKSLVGPHLEGIVGRQVASVAGFEYSQELSSQDFIWDEDRLAQWLERPQQLQPGLCLPFTGIAKPEARAALIDYLRRATADE